MRHVPPSSDPALTAAADAQRGSARVNHALVAPDTGTAESGAAGERVVTTDDVADKPTAAGPSAAWRAPSEPPYARILASDSQSQTIDVPPPDAARAREEELVRAPLRDVIAILASPDRFESAVAESALQRRGMTAVDLDIARRLSDADEAARLLLLDEIAGRPGATLPAWLGHFAVDESAEVRLRALGLLATSRDEAQLADVYAQAVRDGDPRVRALAERLRGTAGPSFRGD
jgi:hypothetical protein